MIKKRKKKHTKKQDNVAGNEKSSTGEVSHLLFHESAIHNLLFNLHDGSQFKSGSDDEITEQNLCVCVCVDLSEVL